MLLLELPDAIFVELRNIGPSQEWQKSQAASQVNVIRRELQKAFNLDEVRNSDSL